MIVKIYHQMGDIVKLPPGFVFSPSDEELIIHFLYSKASDLIPSHSNFIPHLDLSLLLPWELNGKAMCGGNDEDQYYFFTKLKKENRSTKNGFWKEIGVTEPIFSGTDQKVGMKNYLVFNISQGAETSWVMQEYHICSNVFDKVGENWNEWVLCKVYEVEKNMYPEQGYSDDDRESSGTELSWQDQVFLSLDLDMDMEGGISMN
ncbi:NAC domain-containing protein 104-like [Vicia villosa]|uniref:NAC domain-containing protein 104-like n=1 Tax=Vicia villosa TaxID=3911 RepID=UPI00273C8CFC|nr:NAC domain-containing protein 104-like [Vicia villosa]